MRRFQVCSFLALIEMSGSFQAQLQPENNKKNRLGFIIYNFANLVTDNRALQTMSRGKNICWTFSFQEQRSQYTFEYVMATFFPAFE